MDLYPTEEEQALRAAAAEFLAEQMPLRTARSRGDEAWAALAGLGLLGIALPESAQGIGQSHAVEALTFVELGRVLAPVSALAAAVAAHVAAEAGDGDLAAAIVAGRRIGLAIDGAGACWRVLDGAGADLALRVEAGAAMLVHIPRALDWRETIDQTTRQARVDRSACPVARSAPGNGFGQHLAILSAAMALGVAEAARDLSASHASMREQFGRPIGAFQGVKHPCADMAVRCAAARAQLVYAALGLRGDCLSLAADIAAARLLADDAAILNGRATIQVHGGMGMTDDCHAHLLLKRAHLLSFVAPVDRAALLEPPTGGSA